MVSASETVIEGSDVCPACSGLGIATYEFDGNHGVPIVQTEPCPTCRPAEVWRHPDGP